MDMSDTIAVNTDPHLPHLMKDNALITSFIPVRLTNAWNVSVLELDKEMVQKQDARRPIWGEAR